MSVTAKLKIQLTANDVIVAEAEDPILWRKVLAALQKPENKSEELLGDDEGVSDREKEDVAVPAGSALKKFASELGVSVAVLQGAADPKTEAPFIHLNQHNWEALRKATPFKGPGSIAPAVLAGTLAALWAKHAGLDSPTTSTISQILDAIHLPTKNIARGIKNCEWLLLRGSNVVVNPSQTSAALRVAAAYCKKEAPASE